MTRVRACLMTLVLATVLTDTSAISASEGAPETSKLEVTASDKTFKGKGTDAEFPTEVTIEYSGGSTTMRALGSGLRKKVLFKVYEGVAYAENDADLGADPHRGMIEGDFAKRIVMHFLRDVDGEKIRGAWEEGFGKVFEDEELSPELRSAREQFLGYFGDDGVSKGEAIEITWLPRSGLHVVIAGAQMPPVNNGRLASGLMAIWFGDDPVSGGLKKDLIRFVRKTD